ncbi:hypothetical protein [Alloalcanivorax xenomutans]|uniref:hypothetical protein n=1 Tax=Alloalcanivorax xenomutans TaxID=1094342 RepID=UPI003BAA672B
MEVTGAQYRSLEVRWLSLFLSCLLIVSSMVPGWEVKYFFLLLLPWFYLLRGVDIYRPDGVIVFFYYLYSISYPTFLLLSGDLAKIAPLLDMSNLGFAGIFFSVFLFFPKENNYKEIKAAIGFYEFLGIYSRWVVPLLVVFACLLVTMQGLTSKREINDSAGLLSYINRLVFISYIYVSMYVSYLALTKKKFRKEFLWFFLLAMFVLLVIGERDVVFRYAFVVVLFWFSVNGRFRSLYYVFGFVFILLALSISQQAKNIFLTGGLYEASQTGLKWMFYNEFASGSRNLHQILLYGDIFGDVNLIWGDIVRFFSILNLNENAQSATEWYNKYYRNFYDFSGSSGWGFGILPELYYSLGGFGVFFGFASLMAITTFLYNFFWGSIGGRVFVILHYAAFIYSLRADFANLLGLSIKWGAFSIFLAYIAYSIVAKKGAGKYVRS